MGLLRAIIVRTEHLLIHISVMSILVSVALVVYAASFQAAIRADPLMNGVS